MGDVDTSKSGKDPKNVFYKAEKRMERVRFNNYRAERRLKDDIVHLEKHEQFRMTELRHQVLLLQMELRSRRCKEAVMILKEGNDGTVLQKPKKVEPPPPEKKKSDDKPKDHISDIRTRWHSIFAKPLLTATDPEEGTDLSLPKPSPPGFVAEQRRFSSAFVSSNPKTEFVRDVKTAPPPETSSIWKANPLSDVEEFGNDGLPDSSLTDDEVFSDDDDAIQKVNSENNKKPNKLLKAAAMLINTKRLQTVSASAVTEPDMYTDGAMSFAMRQLEYKRRATMPALTGHLPRRKRSIAYNNINNNSWHRQTPNSRSGGNSKLRKSQSKSAHGRKSRSGNTDEDSALLNPHKFTVSTLNFDMNRIYIPKKKEEANIIEESQKNQEQIQKLKHVNQAEKYNNALGKIKVFLGGKAPRGSHIELKELTQEEAYMLKQFKSKTGSVG